MAAFNVPFVNVIVHQPGQQAEPPVPIVMLNQKLHLKGLEEAIGLRRIRIIVAGHPQGIVLTADNDGLVNIPPLEPGSNIEVCGVPAPASSTSAATAAAAAQGGVGGGKGGPVEAAGPTTGAGVDSTQFVTLEFEDSTGATCKMPTPLHQDRLHLPSIEKMLAAKQRVLVDIAGVTAVCTLDGYTEQTFAADSTISLTTSAKTDEDLVEKRKARWAQIITALLAAGLSAGATWAVAAYKYAGKVTGA